MRNWLIAVLLALWSGHATLRVAASPAADEFAAIDAHALAAPTSVANSVPALAAYLTKPARDEREMARAIFRWITHYVAYDLSAEGYSFNPNLVLSRRRAVCAGYAVLFEALAEAAGMKAEIVCGNSKKFKPGATEAAGDWVNHCWNAVQIDGQWRLVDCCWGAGHCDEGGQFVRSFSPHYFLTASEVFVFDHFPSDPRWQLLDPPISKGEYLQRAQVRPPFFDCRLRLVSHRSARIDAGSSLAVVIGAPPETFMMASLYRDGREMEEHYTFAQRCAQGFVILALFPSQGDYVLRVFARRGDATDGDYAWALDYAVRARSGEQGGAGFPEVYGSFLAHNCQLERPLSRALPAGKTAELALTVPNATDVVVVTGGSWKHLSAQGSRFTGEAPVSPGDVVIFARFGGQSAYEGLLRYTGEKGAPAAESVYHDLIGMPSPVRPVGDCCADALFASSAPSIAPDLPPVVDQDPFAEPADANTFLTKYCAAVFGSRSDLFPQSEGAVLAGCAGLIGP